MSIEEDLFLACDSGDLPKSDVTPPSIPSTANQHQLRHFFQMDTLSTRTLSRPRGHYQIAAMPRGHQYEPIEQGWVNSTPHFLSGWF